ncbi:MAG: divergent PAP2 family protein [Culicoidibacterales bacterium]
MDAHSLIATTFPGGFVIMAAMLANFTAQFYKFLRHFVKTREWDITYLFTTGGMPSSHSALVIAAVVSIGIIDGIDTTTFALALIFAAVVLHDALGIRRHAGRQAQVINQMIQDLQGVQAAIIEGGLFNNPKYDHRLKELLGHEPIEVVMGTIWGIASTLIFYWILIAIIQFNLG